ncbi:MAG: hypothetical protein ABIF71_05160 [Planctomycetota bacterium]
MIGGAADFRADNAWHHAEIDLAAMLASCGMGGDTAVLGPALADSDVMGTWQNLPCWIDNFCRVPALDPVGETVFELAWPGNAVAAFSHVLDAAPVTEPVQRARPGTRPPNWPPGPRTTAGATRMPTRPARRSRSTTSRSTTRPAGTRLSRGASTTRPRPCAATRTRSTARRGPCRRSVA